MDYKSIIKDVQDKKFKPLYLLHGEEPYYIDLVAKAIEKEALEDHERDFNQTILYGKDVDIVSLVNELQGFPLMAERKLVIVKEAQSIAYKEDSKEANYYNNYFSNPNPTSILVLCYKYGKLDSRKKIFKNIQSKGAIFLSEKIREYNIASWIDSYLKDKNYTITPKAGKLLADFLGNDLSKITNELDKLAILIQVGTQINEVHIEENIGISKDFNPFELVGAVQIRDVPKIFQIVHYFEHNPKACPFPMLIGQLFGFFIKLMRIHFLTDKSPQNIASQCKINPYFVKDHLTAAKLYNPSKVALNIEILHEYDLKSKGVGSSGNINEAELMKEMIYKLVN
jgi:DNA polymerase-3 subunit delta